MRGILIVATIFVTSFALLAACGDEKAGPPMPMPPVTEQDLVRTTYPTLDALYAGGIGIYRGCGPNNAVCHNGKEFPNLATLGSILENIDVPCNQKKTKPLEMHDLCERTGDRLRIGTASAEIAYIENEDPDQGDTSSKWAIVLREATSADPRTERVVVVRGDVELAPLGDFGVTFAAAGNRIHATIPMDADPAVRMLFAKAGAPGDPASIQLGDPNRNGTFGASLGGRLIKPGRPEASYLFERILNPAAGPLMPRANCCYWSRDAVRALWCWVSGLAPDGSNALAPIDYETCKTSPPDSVLYPQAGPNCEETQKGMCPVQPKEPLTDDPTWANVYPHLFRQTCAGCHAGAAAPGGLDLATDEVAYESVRSRVVPGDPNASKLYRYITPSLCTTGCTLMPFRQQPLDDRTRRVVARWIEEGAKR